ncbi:hypothetical protein NEISUBOT_04766 [Neisseria subflava NJ9703]|uniref:Uncharacterized protein n=1 Tax=Neisseria subflava NJ9703 TaxID=546268 RepID=A0A9W5IQG6_NEISU|nr:hypothetical protein NEISUBOT_04766 [Neisseria subflava NJ9703]
MKGKTGNVGSNYTTRPSEIFRRPWAFFRVNLMKNISICL